MSVLQRFKKITCFVFDVDGVLTDGSLLVFEDGQLGASHEYKRWVCFTARH